MRPKYLFLFTLLFFSCNYGSYEYYVRKRDKAAAEERVWLDKKKNYVSRNPDRQKAALEEAKAKGKFARRAEKCRKTINECNQKLSLLRIKGLEKKKSEQPEKKP